MHSFAILILALVLSTAAFPARHRFGRPKHDGSSRFGRPQNNDASPATLDTSSVAAATPTISSPAISSAASTAAPAQIAAPNTTTNGAPGETDLQTSFTLDPSVVQKGFLNNGQNPPVEGQFPSLTSSNNFINYCSLTLPGTPLTNGQQITTGSCNGAPIGLIPSTEKMPSSKFKNPRNLDTIPANAAFNISLALNNVDAGHFTNAKENYYAAPQQLNAQGTIIGHTHVVIEALSAIDQDTFTDPNTFIFFKGINTPLVNGVVSTPVAAGVPAGVYRLCSQNAAMNHQPVIVPVAQHGNLDDCVYFTAK
ncbi:hypothetical protein C8R43DRAFT_984019 [Mycena crocata]|nr:hypothetical protein C8R43DRAFT_984019 [Mycena crocata]